MIFSIDLKFSQFSISKLLNQSEIPLWLYERRKDSGFGGSGEDIGLFEAEKRFHKISSFQALKIT